VNKKDLIREHYENAELIIDDICRREIALGVRIRGQHFTSTEELAKTLSVRTNIDGAYASIGLYLDPNCRAPSKRGHLGTDLVFDVDKAPDSDRLNWLYEVCSIVSDLIDTLQTELGIPKEKMTLDFSGNKGFHITIADKSYRELSKEDRQQLVQYIKGEKVNRQWLKHGKGGWNKRFASYIDSLTKLMSDDSKTNNSFLLALGLPKITAKKLGDLMTDPTKREALTQGHLSVLDSKILASMQSNFFNRQKEVMSYVDSSVTNDLHKLFRFPGSVHNKTGFVATRLDIEDAYNPDAIFEKVKAAGGLDPVTITLDKEATEDFDQVKVWSAGSHTVPRWLALHLLHQ